MINIIIIVIPLIEMCGCDCSNRVTSCKLIWGIDRFTGQQLIEVLTERGIDW